MTIYDLLYCMDNMNNDIVLQNDARLDDPIYEPLRGLIEDVKNHPQYEDCEDEEVTDVFTESDGTMYICYYNEDEL